MLHKVKFGLQLLSLRNNAHSPSQLLHTHPPQFHFFKRENLLNKTMGYFLDPVLN